MTKKQDKIDQVAENKWQAFNKKVRTLLGHLIYEGRLSTELVRKAYEEKRDALEFAASIAALEPVGKAVHPLKEKAVQRAREYAEDKLEKLRQELIKNDWYVDKVAPYPERTLGDFAWCSAYNYYQFASQVTQWRQSSRSGNDKSPRLVDFRPEGVARYIQKSEELAATQYDLFILKLVQKVGPVLDAKLEGDRVWSHSFLRVKKEGDVKEVWKTQQIENVSKLGLYFPQWPTRKVKFGWL